MSDRLFENDALRFSNNIYGTLKGKIREHVLKEDLSFLNNGKSRSIVDLGAGIGQVNSWLAQAGHNITHVEPSLDMLSEAKSLHAKLNLTEQYEYFNDTIQSFATEGTFDLVCCHAVLEWLENPWLAWLKLTELVADGGYLSLMFYNIEAKRMANLVYGNFDYVNAGLKVKKKVRFSPSNPLKVSEVMNWVAASKLEIVQHSGVRVIHDYLKSPEKIDEQALIDLELRYRKLEPYRALGRYQHILLRKI
ncbi:MULTISPECIES: methyltransferase domain-containing protein [Gammaproteobacteria]|uniref:methyltransferase domain-containing protein n=1 Tax=Gammaproteobacteria TaxID=1236 RepID=UPI000DD03950|nr:MULTISPECIES: methyltransferase domain-containing protein [Gammaproteobacteria]RTE87313.1 methyltransferase domain-containing protein [Aliidiomarina sp. B3213]TCZ92901.1 methyltransferase domain-containing protein [Lysobacter sp. N42]